MRFSAKKNTDTHFDDLSLLIRCAIIAALVELSFISVAGMHFPTFSSEPPHPSAEAMEAEVITLPEEQPKLVAQNAEPSAPEETIAKKDAPPTNANPKTLTGPTSNRLEKGKPLSPTHGPILIESPSPVIPEYLKNKDLNSKVVIEFVVQATGQATPHLLVSSGEEELDQIALSTASKWKFYPAESEHVAIDSKIKLRILFEVK